METRDQLKEEIDRELILIRNDKKYQNDQIVFEIIKIIDDLHYKASFNCPESILDKKNNYIKWRVVVAAYYDSLTYYLKKESLKVHNIKSDSNYTNALSLLNKVSTLSFAKDLVYLNYTDLIKMEMDGNTIKCSLMHKNSGAESIDRSNSEWLKDYISSSNKVEIESIELKQRIKQSIKSGNEFPLIYTTNRQIQDHFIRASKSYIKALIGYDEFLSSATFNNIVFHDYLEITRGLIYLSLVHNSFCNITLNKKKCKLTAHDIRSKVFEEKILLEKLEKLTNIKQKNILLILENLTLSKRNLEVHSYPGNPPAPLIKTQDNKFVLSSSGTLLNPLQFLIREFREIFKTDYSKAIQSRELAFRKQLYELFTSKSIFKCEKEIVLKIDKKIITDIDAMIYDHSSNTLALIQLKWMDLFGNSMKERKSRVENFNNRANAWIEKVQDWLETNNPNKLLSYLDLNNPIEHFKVKKTELIIIGRHFSNFTGLVSDKRATWTNLTRLKRLSIEDPEKLNGLTSLIRILKDDYQLKDLSGSINFPDIQIGRYILSSKIK